jgi:hypothetical protein
MKKHAKTSTVLLVLMLLAPISGALAQTTNPTWNIQTIVPSISDHIGRGGYDSSFIILDSNGNPHLIYCVSRYQQSTIVNYANWNGTGWSIQTIGQGFRCGLALDLAGYPHIIYFSSNEINYLTLSASGWTTQMVKIEDSSQTPLVLVPHGNLRIEYLASYQYVKFFAWDGSGWELQTLDSSYFYRLGFNILFSSLTLDSIGKQHISFIDTTGLKYATWTGIKWNIQTIDSFVTESDYNSVCLALDAHDNPSILYLGNSSLKYANWTGSTWSIQAIDNMGIGTSLVIDSTGTPQISYYNNGLRYAIWTNSTWNIQTVGYDYPSENSLALDSKGNPHILYVKDGLKYASLGIFSSSPIPIETTIETTNTIDGYIFPLVIGLVAMVVFLAVLLLLRKRRVKEI